MLIWKPWMKRPLSQNSLMLNHHGISSVPSTQFCLMQMIFYLIQSTLGPFLTSSVFAKPFPNLSPQPPLSGFSVCSVPRPQVSTCLVHSVVGPRKPFTLLLQKLLRLPLTTQSQMEMDSTSWNNTPRFRMPLMLTPFLIR